MQETFCRLQFYNYNLSKLFLDWRRLWCVLILQRHESEIDKFLIGYDNQKEYDFSDNDSKGRRKNIENANIQLLCNILQTMYVWNIKRKKLLLAKRTIKKGKLLGGGIKILFSSQNVKKVMKHSSILHWMREGNFGWSQLKIQKAAAHPIIVGFPKDFLMMI